MISFVIALLALVAGYFIYGKIVERVFAPDKRPTPATLMADGVDYMVLPNWKVYMIQFLNIAGTGPVFGAIMGAWYGPASYVWIVLGSIFAGAVHDYLSGMLSMRFNGAGLPKLIGMFLGNGMKQVMLVFSVFLLLMVGAVFVYSPALLLKDFCFDTLTWVLLIFLYYIFATMLPIDKLIGKLYPLFAFALIFMALALLVVLFVKMPPIPELWSNLPACNLNEPTSLLGTDSFVTRNPIFPCMFITIACGAISGFHATQSPLMARCLKSEGMGRPIFYGAMITEGVVALIWASVSSYFFYCGGWREVVDANMVQAFLSQAGTENGKTLIQYFSAPTVVQQVCTGWLGLLGGLLAVLGVVAAPITSGDTALRSARLIIAESFHIGQQKLSKRFLIAIPMFVMVIALLVWQMENPDGFNALWQWFGWANQTLSVFTLWALTVYLARHHKPFVITLLPALLMTVVCSSYLLFRLNAFNLGFTFYIALGCGLTGIVCLFFINWYRKFNHNNCKK